MASADFRAPRSRLMMVAVVPEKATPDRTIDVPVQQFCLGDIVRKVSAVIDKVFHHNRKSLFAVVDFISVHPQIRPRRLQQSVYDRFDVAQDSLDFCNWFVLQLSIIRRIGDYRSNTSQQPIAVGFEAHAFPFRQPVLHFVARLRPLGPDTSQCQVTVSTVFRPPELTWLNISTTTSVVFVFSGNLLYRKVGIPNIDNFQCPLLVVIKLLVCVGIATVELSDLAAHPAILEKRGDINPTCVQGHLDNGVEFELLGPPSENTGL